jgi:UDP-N-acetylglucosamine--N-acetylmuramyl-(pentapeptide) pyrophosphoryl-undecaprenol N-acetylglucosamine transferase
MNARRLTFAIVAGGGTAGHLGPALAISRALEERHGGHGSVEIVCTRRDVDATVLEGAELPVHRFPGRGFARSGTLGGLASNLVTLVLLGAALAASLALLVRRRPAVVVGVGGFSCVGPSLAARLLGVPVVLVNVDAVPGAANRLVGRIAAASAAAWPGSGLPRSRVTGAPVSSAIEAAAQGVPSRIVARASLGLPEDATVVAAYGGSLGARRVNEAVLGMVEGLRGDAGASVHDGVEREEGIGIGRVHVFHVTGTRDSEWARKRADGLPAGPPGYTQVPYEHQMPTLHVATDLAISRAGAMTIAELAAVGVPALLVPLPGAPGDHQNANARLLQEAGAALIVADDQCTPERLRAEIEVLMADRARLEKMARAASNLGRPRALHDVVTLIEEMASA